MGDEPLTFEETRVRKRPIQVTGMTVSFDVQSTVSTSVGRRIHKFPSASNHSTHCWVDTQCLGTNFQVAKTTNPFTGSRDVHFGCVPFSKRVLRCAVRAAVLNPTQTSGYEVNGHKNACEQNLRHNYQWNELLRGLRSCHRKTQHQRNRRYAHA